YNDDNIDMYNPIIRNTKTLVKLQRQWVPKNQFSGDARKTLLDIVATEIAPELLPAGKDDKIVHRTEDVVGPYELLDFFLFQFLRYGATPEKILFLSGHAQFDHEYSGEERKR